jgi:hypothetical protein
MTRFVKEWNNIYENYRIKIIKKTRRVPKYIIKIIRNILESRKSTKNETKKI